MATAARASRPWMEVPDSYSAVEGLLRAGAPLVFVSGNAGTGKTTLIQYLTDVLPQHTVVVAPTGVAALNVGGVTVHSFFRFPPRIQDPSEIRPLRDPALIRSLDLLVVDEVSMLRCDLMDGIDVFLRKNRRSQQPFGGVQLLLVGDLFQLPPVVPRAEREVLETMGYATPYFFSALGLREVPLAHVELDHVFRQADPEFVGLLNKLRVAENREHAVGEINSRCYMDNEDSLEDLLEDDFDMTLTCTNAQAEQINEASMESLDTAEHTYRGEIYGRFRLDESRLPSPLELRLKSGARVMFTKNDEGRRWINGTSGVVVDLSDQSIRVRIGGPSGPVFDVEPVTWESHEYAFDKDEGRITARKLGDYTQFPLMLAWAVTIHKSQGKTLDRVLVDLGHGAFSPGQVYVALSRCRSLEGIRLARPLRPSDVKCDHTIRRFYEALAEGAQ